MPCAKARLCLSCGPTDLWEEISLLHPDHLLREEQMEKAKVIKRLWDDKVKATITRPEVEGGRTLLACLLALSSEKVMEAAPRLQNGGFPHPGTSPPYCPNNARNKLPGRGGTAGQGHVPDYSQMRQDFSRHCFALFLRRKPQRFLIFPH